MAKNAKNKDSLDASAQELLHLLAKGALSVDQIAQLTATAIPETLGILTELELLGKVFQSRPGLYQLRKNV